MSNTKSSNAVLLYCTASSEQEAWEIGAVLVEENLAACVNILPVMHSIYRWEGKTEQARESVFLVKTIRDHVSEITARIIELHSYDCPAVVCLPIESGATDFLHWIEQQVKPV